MAVNRDTLKTVGGLVVIAVIIVGAFLYGNAQHQNQVRQDKTAKQQSGQSSAPESNAGSVGQAPAKPSAQATPNPLQASAAAPSASPAPGKGGITQTPQTGAANELIPLAFLTAGWVLYRRSLPQRAAKRA